MQKKQETQGENSKIVSQYLSVCYSNNIICCVNIIGGKISIINATRKQYDAAVGVRFRVKYKIEKITIYSK